MASWQYNILVVDLGSAVMKVNATVNKMWEVRGPDGLTDWDRLLQLGRDGWELVNTFRLRAVEEQPRRLSGSLGDNNSSRQHSSCNRDGVRSQFIVTQGLS